MHLKLNDLNRVVRGAVREHRAVSALRVEIGRVLGPSVITEGRISDVAAAANDRIDVLERTGRMEQLRFKPHVVLPLLESVEPELRRLAARTVPQQHLARLGSDADPGVRAAAGARVPIADLVRMVRRFPQDDQLRVVLRARRLDEGGVPQPKAQPMGHDAGADGVRTGEAIETSQGPELSEAWYREHAQRFMHDYGKNIEYAWEATAVRRFCSSCRATTGLEVDEARLLRSIHELIEEREDRALERDALQETAARLMELDERCALRERAELPPLDEEVDPVHELLESRVGHEEYVARAREVFRIQDAIMPLAMRKYRLGEGNARQVLVPTVGRLPHGAGFRAVDERALDAFCEAWSARQAMVGEPLRIEWTNHPADASKVGFTCVLR